MVILNSLKVLSAGTRYSFSVPYSPSRAMRKAFILPETFTVHVEIFPISEIDVFAQSEPVYFIDAYLGCKCGSVYITPCTSAKFMLPEWFDLVGTDDTLTKEKVMKCAIENISLIIQSAMRKSGSARFHVNNPVTLQLAVFLLKINRVKEAHTSIKENIPSSFSISKTLPYFIYEIFSSVLLDRNDPSVLDSISYISTALNRMSDSTEENRVINAILVGLQHSTLRRPPSVLNMYSRLSVAPHKAPMFYYLLALAIGPGYSTKYTLIGLSMNTVACGACSSPGVTSTKKALNSILSMETDLGIDRTPCDLVLDEHMHRKTETPDPELRICTRIGQYITQAAQDIESTEIQDVYTLKNRIIYTEGEIVLELDDSTVEIIGIVIKRPPSETAVLSTQGILTQNKEIQYIAPLYKEEKKYTFFVSTACTLLQIQMSHKGRKYSKETEVSIEVLKLPVNKKIVSHRLNVISGATVVDKSANNPNIEAYEKALKKYIQAPFSVVSYAPLHIRIPFSYNESMLYSQTVLNWEYVEFMRVAETEEFYLVTALEKDISVQYADVSLNISAGVEEKLQKQTQEAASKIHWILADKTKSGELLLR